MITHRRVLVISASFLEVYSSTGAVRYSTAEDSTSASNDEISIPKVFEEGFISWAKSFLAPPLGNDCWSGATFRRSASASNVQNNESRKLEDKMILIFSWRMPCRGMLDLDFAPRSNKRPRRNLMWEIPDGRCTEGPLNVASDPRHCDNNCGPPDMNWSDWECFVLTCSYGKA